MRGGGVSGADPFERELYRGRLARGCVDCGQGAKLVLLVTGLCRRDCFYCPLSETRKDRDVQFANERPITSIREAVDEALTCSAIGTGITGGDPIRVRDRTISYIKELKAKMGPDHHIHLYTSEPVDAVTLARLEEAGLDEIRFHPPYPLWRHLFSGRDSGLVEQVAFEEAIERAVASTMDCGVEIPALPALVEDMLKLAGHMDRAGVDFLNLNELEMSSTNADALVEHGYHSSGSGASVSGSFDAAVRVMEQARVREGGMGIHICSAAFKDSVQLTNRLGRRAFNVRRPYEVVTDENTLLFGSLEPDDDVTGSWMKGMMKRLDELGIDPKLYRAVPEKGRIEIAAWLLDDMDIPQDALAFLVEEYPTFDRLEVERAPMMGQAPR